MKPAQNRFPVLFAALLLLASGASLATLPPGIDGQPLPSLAPMLKKVTPAVVNISSKHHVRARDPFLDDPFFRQFFGLPGQPRQRVEQALGSGVIVNADKGYILTNNHVIRQADDISVTLQDGRKFKATVVGADPATDVAVIRIPPQNLTALPVADSDKLQVGDFVVAVGEPFGFGQTVTSGIVSALRRTGLGHTYQSFIQTDASINPGNSGGALVNLAGQLVGINSMIYSPSGASAGIGFAIPSDLAMSVMHQLIRYGHVRRGSLGVETQDISERIARALRLPDAEGALVTRVDADSPAASAGIREGDVIVAVNGQKIANVDQLNNTEGLLPVGKPVQLDLLRQGQTVEVTTRLQPEVLATATGNSIDPRLDGASLSDLSKRQRDNGLSGVRIQSVADDSRAAANGLLADDLLVAVGRLRIDNLKALRSALSDPPQRLILTVVRQGRALYVPMQ